MKSARSWFSVLRAGLGVGLCTAIAACGGGGSGEGDGRLSLSVTDAPIDHATSVVVQFSGVAFKREGMSPETVEDLDPSPRQIDLLQFQDGRAAVLLDNVVLPAGRYEWLRLIVDNEPNVRDSFLMLDTGAECELRVPSGAQSGLKLNRGFTLPAGGSVVLTVDFDLHKSIHAPPGQSGSGLDCTQAFLLRPTLRLVDNANVGAIAGQVDPALVTTDCLPKVYVFEGSGVTPDDVEESTPTTPDVDPVLVARVSAPSGTTQYQYRASFVPAGAYTLAFSCGDDDPTADETLTFSAPQNATVQSNLITTVDFVAPPAGG
ncbi:MAG TPA: DUF4382 domain-containing protein [Steroidobacteraceae bacterium]|nr:DUF4382 domain-containing protein [Steroidobacteraceae bacterium]